MRKKRMAWLLQLKSPGSQVQLVAKTLKMPRWPLVFLSSSWLCFFNSYIAWEVLLYEQLDWGSSLTALQLQRVGVREGGISADGSWNSLQIDTLGQMDTSEPNMKGEMHRDWAVGMMDMEMKVCSCCPKKRKWVLRELTSVHYSSASGGQKWLKDADPGPLISFLTLPVLLLTYF